MNIHDIQSCFTLACAADGIICIAAILLYAARHQLRQLLDRWLALGRLGQCVSLLMLTVFVLYAGTKPPSSTNEPTAMMVSVKTVTGSGEAESFPLVPKATRSTDNETLACMVPSAGRNSARGALSLQAEGIPIPHSLTNWTARGAYCDWQRIDFPDGFAFPHGTNLLTSITLFAWGEIRENHHCSPSPSIFTFPAPLSLEPGVSTCAYGLTASNSFVFAWQDACVEREGTNRVDAAIELFASGDVQVRFGDSATNIVARPPEGFVGVGQDNDWALAAFPDDYDAITNKCYEAWLMEDKVGINEQNGLYKVSITVSQLPDVAPCYLVCGPYKVIVTAPGTYSFPLEVFEHYTARTYPVAVPLSIDYDDGYRDEASDLGLLRMSPQRQLLGVPLIFPPIYDIWQEPRIVISPTEIPLDQAVGTHISIWCNVASVARRYSALISREFRLNFCNPSDAEIIAAEVEDLVEIIIDAPLGTCAGTITITDLHPCCGCGSCTGSGCTCGCDCWRHQSSNDTPTNSPPVAP